MKIRKNKISLPQELSEYVKEMTDADTGELRVLVYLLSKEEETDYDEISNELKLDKTDVISAVSYWRGAGYVSVENKTGISVVSTAGQNAKQNNSLVINTDSLKNSVRDFDSKTYTGTELANLMEKPDNGSLLNFARERLEKPLLSPKENSDLIYLMEEVLLSPNMLMRIIDYCAEINKKSVRYVFKTAIDLADNHNIKTYEELEKYFEKKKAAQSAEETVRSIMGIGERNFTALEKRHIKKWFEEFNSSKELIEYAYEKTITNISKPSISYMSKLLEKWFELGCKSVNEVENQKKSQQNTKNLDLATFDEAVPQKDIKKSDSAVGLDLDDFFENT